ncbi:cytochrome c oxidase subunit I [Egibacter rhizosphaerae]|uniref:Cytochrome c oxidase subunit 1 n=1 Tax=Egibacter rhizosphaerae TaxID=1670831 RepID=A0A411YAX1_9ACTN|nr:cytochrome c oxidase subunit I [Egibacter rhizosphaerae]QBI18383.1 cytochrome c oxidase subunit I [Egibacter rhizosphaerae]
MSAPPADRMEATWATKPGVLGWLGAVNHKQVGKRFLVTAIVFFAFGGIQALLMRWQLGAPGQSVLDAQTYNELFTMHGTTMLFLFAVPITEALAIYFAPLMLGTRDMPFPRLNAFGYWAYLAGGIFLYASFFAGSVPDGGWFAYTPLTGPEYSPGDNIDFWLLGVTFVEISGIVAALEIVVLVLKTRAAGMTFARLPLFVWSVFVTALMVLFAFPPLVMGSIMLELDRKVGTVFFNPDLGGDPVLWQHIFWWFGHPEVYIMSLPTFGVVSTLIPVFARHRMVAYPLVAAATVAIGIMSFGTWVHHMFATGLPFIGLAFFAAGTLLITIPSGVQIFAWIATLWNGRPKWDPPLLYVMGFFIVFVTGGLTGVMFAMIPFTWQAHDTYFVVAHFHYVIIGSTVFPLLAALYYWTPKITGRMLSARLGHLGFWLFFIGVNVTFFPMHQLGFDGMARRIWTYEAGLGWELGNLVASIGAVVSALGIAVVLFDLFRGSLRGPTAGNDPWDGGTLEWAATSPPAQYNFSHSPRVLGRYPLWDGVAEDGAGALVERADRRELLISSVLDAEPERLITIPVHSLWPLGTALSVALLLFAVLVDMLALFIAGALGVAVCLIAWGWSRQDVP